MAPPNYKHSPLWKRFRLFWKSLCDPLDWASGDYDRHLERKKLKRQPKICIQAKQGGDHRHSGASTLTQKALLRHFEHGTTMYVCSNSALTNANDNAKGEYTNNYLFVFDIDPEVERNDSEDVAT